MEFVRPETAVLTLTANGYGKRTPIDDYRVTSRGGVGIINIQTSERNGRVVGVASVMDTDEVMLITQQGKMLRTAAGTISLIGRNTQGVRLIEMDDEDRAVSLARLEEQDSDLAEPEDGEPTPPEEPGAGQQG
jgi:DNA gyrase subunit A